MKTNELIKKLEKFDGIKIYHQDFISLSMNGIKIAIVGKIGQWLNIYSNCQDEVAKLLFDYYLTPLEEREEEKRFYLKLKTNMKIIEGCNGEMKYLNYFEKEKSSYIASKVSAESIQTLFTDKDIKELNIDMNLFEKEYVDE